MERVFLRKYKCNCLGSPSEATAENVGKLLNHVQFVLSHGGDKARNTGIASCPGQGPKTVAYRSGGPASV